MICPFSVSSRSHYSQLEDPTSPFLPAALLLHPDRMIGKVGSECGIPVSADTWLSNIGLLFIVGRTHVLKRLMQPLSVIEDFDPLKDRAPGFLAGPEVPVPNQFVLEAAEKTLGDGIVITVALAAHTRDHAVRAAQAGDPVAPTPQPFGLERTPGLDNAIGLAGLGMQGADAPEQLPVRLRAATLGPVRPAVEATRRYLQCPAERADPVFALMVGDELVPHADSLAKYRAAFFKIVFSSCKRAFSRCRRASSAARPRRRPGPGNTSSGPLRWSCSCHL